MILELLIDLDTGDPLVTATPTVVSVSISEIPAICVWFAVPNLDSKLTSEKLKSLAAGFVLLADCCKTCVPFRNTSLRLPFVYSVEP